MSDNLDKYARIYYPDAMESLDKSKIEFQVGEETTFCIPNWTDGYTQEEIDALWVELLKGFGFPDCYFTLTQDE